MPVPAPLPQTTLASLGLAWNVVATRELPGGTLAWLKITPYAGELGPSCAARDLVIAETGVVARLSVRNPSRSDVLLPCDLVVDGGKQARIVERSLIVPAAGAVDVPVRCVEAGRWHARDAHTASTFEVAESVSTESREHLTQLKKVSLRKRKTYGLDQHEVWTHVASTLDREELSSPTSSYSAVLMKRTRQKERAKSLDVRSPPGVNGVAVIRRSGAAWVEGFPSQGHVDEALTSFVADLMDESPAARTSVLPATTLALSALRMTWRAQTIALSTPPGTRGTTFAFDAEGVAGFALLVDGRLAHLAASVGM